MIRAVRRIESYKLQAKFGWPLLLAVAIFYLTFHALSGERGVYALLKEERRLEVMKAELVDVEAQRKDLEHRVRLMSSSSLDLDLLDEQARAILGVAGSEELVIPLGDVAPSAAGPHAN